MLKQRRRGFSLVELVVVLALLGIIFAIATPELTTWTQNTRIKAAATSHLSGLQLARAEAIKANASVTFTLSGDLTNNNGWTITDATGNILTTRDASEGLGDVKTTVSSPAGASSPFTVIFNGLGRMTSPTSPAAFAVTPVSAPCIANQGKARCINVNVQMGGHISICDPAVPSTDPRAC